MALDSVIDSKESDMKECITENLEGQKSTASGHTPTIHLAIAIWLPILPCESSVGPWYVPGQSRQSSGPGPLCWQTGWRAWGHGAARWQSGCTWGPWVTGTQIAWRGPRTGGPAPAPYTNPYPCTPAQCIPSWPRPETPRPPLAFDHWGPTSQTPKMSKQKKAWVWRPFYTRHEANKR